MAGALKVAAPSGRRASALASTAVVAAVMVAVVGVTTIAGTFDWRQPGLAEAMARNRGSSGDGSLDVMQIKGYTTLAEVAEATGIPSEEFTATFGVSAEDLGLPLKDLREKYGFTPGHVTGVRRGSSARVRRAAPACYTTGPRPRARARGTPLPRGEVAERLNAAVSKTVRRP